MRRIEITLVAAAALPEKTSRALPISVTSKTGDPGVGDATLASGSGPASVNPLANAMVI
ncbi:MAG: hypothetical protein ACLPTZ_28535 [Beijerinckiaceae bacterium]